MQAFSTNYSFTMITFLKMNIMINRQNELTRPFHIVTTMWQGLKIFGFPFPGALPLAGKTAPLGQLIT